MRDKTQAGILKMLSICSISLIERAWPVYSLLHNFGRPDRSVISLQGLMTCQFMRDLKTGKLHNELVPGVRLHLHHFGNQ